MSDDNESFQTINTTNPPKRQLFASSLFGGFFYPSAFQQLSSYSIEKNVGDFSKNVGVFFKNFPRFFQLLLDSYFQFKNNEFPKPIYRFLYATQTLHKSVLRQDKDQKHLHLIEEIITTCLILRLILSRRLSALSPLRCSIILISPCLCSLFLNGFWSTTRGTIDRFFGS